MPHLCVTVDLEEWYHTLWFDAGEVVNRHCGGKYPKGGFLGPLKEILALLRRHRARATFFVLKEIAEGFPEAVRQVHDEGHEVGSHGYRHGDLSADPKFEEKEAETRRLLCSIVGEGVRGFRAPNLKVNGDMIDSLGRIGYSFDSSIMPSVRIPGWYGGFAPQHPYKPSRLDPRRADGGSGFVEVPLLVFPGLRLPAGAGWFVRNLGASYVRAAAEMQLKLKRPAILYVHPWEAAEDPGFPEVPGHVFRRVGRYVLGALEVLLSELDAKKATVSEMLQEWS
ncbi:MAG: polysaccharide deacetylase family protein [Candidatus Brockarchaeota archaeon]|nr:polysaccharide deacetylase family protein [Candidatus Brockarchaeota archaeon]